MSGARLLVAQARLEQRAFWRNPEAAFFTFALPVGLLLLFGAISGNDDLDGRPGLGELTYFVPGILAFGVVVAAYGTLAATVASLRSEGVLKRVRATPLPPGTYLAGHLASVLATTLLTAAATVVLGRLVFGVAPRGGGLPVLVAVLAVGIVCFSSLGLAVSALIRNADAAGAITNATYLPVALVSGTFDAELRLPGWLDGAVGVLPVKPLVDGLRAAYDPAVSGLPWADLAVLGAWAVLGAVLARRYFRWQPS